MDWGGRSNCPTLREWDLWVGGKPPSPVYHYELAYASTQRCLLHHPWRWNSTLHSLSSWKPVPPRHSATLGCQALLPGSCDWCKHRQWPERRAQQLPASLAASTSSDASLQGFLSACPFLGLSLFTHCLFFSTLNMSTVQ